MTTISLAPPLRRTRSGNTRPIDGALAGLGQSVKVRTLTGWRRVNLLMAGDLVLNSAGELHELRGVRQASCHGANLVRIARKGRAPLVVGAGQHVSVDDWRARVVFGQAAVCPVARLVDGRAFVRGQPRDTVLYQLHFDSAVCLDIDGAWAVVTRTE